MDYLTDTEPGARVGMLTTQKGFSEVLLELKSRQSEHGAMAGIPDAEIEAADLTEQRIAQIDAVLPAVLKLGEVLVESRAVLEDERQRRVLEFAAQIDKRSRRFPKLRALYAKTRAYRSAPGNKAAATRRRNQANADAGADTPTEE